MLFKNTLALSVNTITGYLLSFLLAPILISQLGLEQFGIWAVVGAMAAYAGMVDLGITRSVSRYVAYYHARGDMKGVGETLGLGLMASGVIAVFSVSAAIVAAPLVAEALHLATGTARTLLVCAATVVSTMVLRSVVNSVMIGMRRMVPPAVASTSVHILNFVASVVVLLVSPKLVDYAIVNAAVGVIGIAANVTALFYVLRRPPLHMPSRARTREIMGYGVKSQFVWLSELVNSQTDKIIIAVLVNVRAAAAFEVGSRVVVAVKAIGAMTVSAMIPTATAAIVQHGRTAIADFYRRYTTRSVAIAFPLFVVAAISSPFLVFAWIGEVPNDSDAVLVVLSLANFVNVTSGVAMTTALGDGQAGMVASNAVLSAALNILFTVILAPIFGLWGVVIGTAMAISATTCIFLARFHRRYGLSFRDYWRAVGQSAALALGLGLPFGLWLVLGGGTPDSRLGAAVVLAGIGLLYMGPYWVAASRLGLLPAKMTLPAFRRRPAPEATTIAR